MKILKKIIARFKPSVKIHPVFKDAELDARLASDGFLTMPLLDADEFTGLKELVTDINTRVDLDNVHIKTGFSLSAFNNDAAYKRELYERIYPVLKDKLENLLEDYMPLMINVFSKDREKEHNQVDIHQNPSFVEEPGFRSVSVWIPMQDVYKSSGTVGVLRGSHGKYYPVRASNMPMIYDDIAKKLVNELFEPLELKTGSAIVLDDSVIHWSYPNYSIPVRVAVQVVMVPRKAPHIYYYHRNTVVEKFAVTPEYFFGFNCKNFPEGLAKIGEVKCKYANIQESQL